MPSSVSPKQALNIVSKAWGRQKGWAFFPVISGTAKDRESRIKSYREGQAYMWPRDKQKIIQHLEKNKNNDVYWCPMLFEKPQRRADNQMDEHALWADLDQTDPREIDDYPPSIAWETSPGRYQAIWLLQKPLMGASWPGNENQRMTQHVGADPSGWDTTQLLRLPGWPNHKPEYIAEHGKPPPGKLLWADGRLYFRNDLDDLPTARAPDVMAELAADQIEGVDRHAAWGRVRLKVSGRVREFMAVTDEGVASTADRSSVLWEIERELADAGCTVAEIVAIIRETVWNKYAGRQDEVKRLVTEATKAIANKKTKHEGDLEEEHEGRQPPVRVADFIKNVKKPTWIVRDVLTAASVGFIAGQPKSWKTWISLDLIYSVATGAPFLGYFKVEQPGPVLYIQEEDPAPLFKDRWSTMRRVKVADWMDTEDDGSLVWHPPQEHPDPDVMVVNKQGISLSDPGDQSWIAETLEQGVNGRPYSLLLLDPLGRMMGEVEENKAQAMNDLIFGPLDQLRERFGVCVQIVHHMRKSTDAGARGGQLMLGSVALHGFSEESMYVRRGGKKGEVWVERESKSANPPDFRLKGLTRSGWQPVVDIDKDRVTAAREPKIVGVVRDLGPGWHTTKEISTAANLNPNAVLKQLQRALSANFILKVPGQGKIPDRWKCLATEISEGAS